MPSRKRTVRQASIVRAFADRLRSIRQARGMTQRELADRAHITVTYVSRLEAGGAAPGIDLLERLAAALGVKVTELLPATPGEDADAQRERLKGQFEVVVKKSGPQTLGMIDVFLTRIAESPAIAR